MYKIRFDSKHEPYNNSVAIYFESETDILSVRFSDVYAQHQSPLQISFTKQQNPEKESVINELLLSFCKIEEIQNDVVFSHTAAQGLAKQFALAYSNQAELTQDIILSSNRAFSIENSISVASVYEMSHIHISIDIGWTNSTSINNELMLNYTLQTVCEQSFIIAYAPTSQDYICYREAHPDSGKVHLTFNKVHQQTLPLIRLSIPEQVCFWGVGGGPIRSDDDIPAVDTKIPIEPQLQRAYIMQPTIMCERLSDAQTILISQFSYSISRAQFSATGSIKFCSRIDMERAINQELKLTINGYEFIVICEQPTTSHKFANSSFSANIRSRFALLSAPYVTTTNYTNTVDKTMAGIMSDVLTNTGWTLDNQMIDYPVPKGAFSYRDLTPATALLKVAKSIGAILDVDNINRVVSIVPEWPVNPWNTSNATCDVILNDSLIIEHNTRQTISPEFTAVFVRGEQQGVACKIKRQDTTASDYARDIVDSLITDNQAARQRGTRELARSGNKQESTIRTKLLDTLPPARPGMLVGIRYTDSLYKATCDSVTLSASINNDGAITVNQTIKVISNV